VHYQDGGKMAWYDIYRGYALRIVIGIATLVLLTVGGAGAAAPISACTTISSPGEYLLTQSIENFSMGTCISITSNDVVFDGANYAIDGVTKDDTYGVYVKNQLTTLTNVTVKNLKITDWDYGIRYYNAQNGSITNNIANSNRHNGIYLRYSSNSNTLINNTANSNNQSGIYLDSSNNSTLINNTANSNNYDGIHLNSSNNTLINNTANSNNHSGIYLDSSNNSTLINNTANSNSYNGFYLNSSKNNVLTSNTANSNGDDGIFLKNSSSNNITDNFFNNTNNVISNNSTNTWNITRQSGTNIIGGSYLGGNVWASPNGIGFSRTCADSNSDGICDSSYTLDSNNTDYLPLAYKPAIAPTPTPIPTATPTQTPTSTPTPAAGNTKGDVSGDGSVTVVDALFVAQYTVGTRTLTSTQLAPADVNGDGEVTIVDALFIAQYTVGLRQL